MRKLSKFMLVLLTVVLMSATLSACDLFGGDDDNPIGGGTTPVIVTYTVTFNSNGGSELSPITGLAKNVLIAKPQTNPKRIGYDFLGWYKTEAQANNAAQSPNDGLWIFTGEEADRVSVNTTLYAGWKPNNLSQACDISDTFLENKGFTVDDNGTASDTSDDFYSLIIGNAVSEFDFQGIGVSAGAVFGIYYNGTANKNLVYVSDGAEWADAKEALPAGLLRVTQYSSDYGSTRVAGLKQGNNYFYIVVLAEERQAEKTYKFVVRRGSVYSVTFVNDSNMQSVNVAEGATANPPAGVSEREGYDLNGWWYMVGNVKYTFVTAAQATEAAPATVINNDMTVYASTTAKQYSVVLNTAGINLTGETNYQVRYDGADYSFAVPTKPQAKFTGWYNGSTQVTDSKGKLIGFWKITSGGTITLTSRWEMNKYNLNLINTNVNAGTATAGREVEFGSTVQLAAIAESGYIFLGWSTDAVNPQSFITALPSYNYTFNATSDVTLYAHWSEMTYDFTVDTGEEAAAGGAKLLDGEGVEYGATSVNTVAYRSESAIQLPVFSYLGYTFNGWYFAYTEGFNDAKFFVSDATGFMDVAEFISFYRGINDDAVAQSYTFYPDFEVANYGVTLTTNAEDMLNLDMEVNGLPVAASLYLNSGAQRFMHSNQIVLRAASNIICTFEGWYVNGSANPLYKADGVTLEDELVLYIDRDYTAHAKYSVNEYSISYNITTITVPYGSEFTWPSVPKVTGADALGMAFEYFYIDNGLPGDEFIPFTDANGKGTMTVAGNIDIKAKWKYKESGIRVTADNTSAGTVACELVSALYKDRVTVVAVTNTGYTFTGWYKVVNGIRGELPVSTNLSYTFSMPSSSVDLVAVWSANRYTVRIADYNGNTLQTNYAVFGESIFLNKPAGDISNPNDLALSINSGIMYVRQYQFNGWQADYNGEVRVIAGIDGLLDIVWDIDSDITLTPNKTSVFIINGSTVIGITDYGKADCYTGIEIPAEIDGQAITAIGANAFADWTALRSAKISKNIVSVGANAFRNCTALTTLEFTYGGLAGSTASALTTIGDYAFRNCVSLTAVSLPRLITSYGSGIFYGSTAVNSVTYNGAIVLGRLFGTTSAPASTAVVQNNVTYYIPTALNRIVFVSGTTNIADYALQNVQISNIVFPNTVKVIGAAAFENSLISNINVVVDGSNNVGLRYLSALDEVKRNAFSGSAVTNLELPASIRVVGSSAFANCLGLTTVAFSPYTDTVFEAMFKGCTNLTTLSSWGGITTIEAEAFYGCANLTSFSSALSRVYAIGERAFYNCTAFTNSNILTDFAGATSIGYQAFQGSGLLSSMIGRVYYSAQYDSIGTDFNMDGLDASFIADKAFESATGLVNIILPKEIVSIGADAFKGLTSLTSVTIEGLESGESYRLLYIFKNAFYGCTGLNEVLLPDTVSIVSSGAFYGTTALTRIFFTATETDNAVPDGSITDSEFGNIDTIAEKAFASSGLLSITLPASLRTLELNAFEKCIALTKVVIEDDGFKSIPNYAFYECTNLEELTLGNAVSAIGKYAFYKTKLSVLETPAGSTLKTIGEYAFAQSTYADSHLTRVILPTSVNSVGNNAFANNRIASFEASGLSIIADNLFKDCVNLSTVKLGNISTIGKYAFYRCSSLIYFNEDRVFNNSITSVGDFAFYGCTNLRGHAISESSALTFIGNSAFRNCVLFNELFIPDTVTFLGDQAFSGCFNISSLTFEDNSKLTKINYAAFKGNSSLQSVVLPEALVTLDDEAFNSCNSLTSVTFGTNIAAIGNDAFGGCGSLTRVTFLGSEAPELGSGAFVTGTARFYVNELYEAEFKSAASWDDYKVYVYVFTV